MSSQTPSSYTAIIIIVSIVILWSVGHCVTTLMIDEWKVNSVCELPFKSVDLLFFRRFLSFWTNLAALWQLAFTLCSTNATRVNKIQTPQRGALTDQHKSACKPFLPEKHRVPVPTSPHLPPPRETRGQAQKGRGCQARHMALGLGTTEVEVPAGPFSFYKAVPPRTTPPLDTHLRRMGKAHSRPSGRSEAAGTAIPQSYTPLSSPFSTSSPSPLSCRLRPAHVIRQTASCCITHTPLCPCLRRSQPCSLM